MKPLILCRWVLVFLLLSGLAAGSRPAFGAPGKQRRQLNQAAADELFTNGALHVLKIEISKKGMDSLRRNARAYVEATLQEGPLVLTNAKVHLKGGAGSFRQLGDKPGLTLNLSECPTTFHGLKKFHLNNSVQDDTYLSEWICSDIFRQAGVPAARVAHAVVELNGRRLGMYALLESVNRDFLARYFKDTRGNVYSLSQNADIDGGLERDGGQEETVGRDLERLAAVANEADPERRAVRLAQVLDVPRFLSFMAVERLLDHWDGYTANVKNYSVYHNLDTDQMVFMPHDLDQMLRDTHAAIVLPQAHGMVARAVLRNPEFRARYRKRFEEIYTNIFIAPVLNQRIDERVTLLVPALRQYNSALANRFPGQAEDLKDRINRRARALAQELKLPDPGRPKFINNTLPVRGWRIADSEQSAKLERVTDPSGKPVLWIAATGQTTASWRAKVLLDPGRYVFEGKVRSAGVQAISGDDRGQGAGLRISGSSRSQANKLVGDSSGQTLAFEFEVGEDRPEVELICELRARKGEARFEEESLRLVRRK